MLTLSTLGFLLGSMVGETVGGNFIFYNLIRRFSPVTFGLALFFRFRQPKLIQLCGVFAFWMAFMWGAVHNPPRQGLANKVSEVVFASGCAQIADDLIVRQGDQIYGVRGRAAVGDLVQLSGRSYLHGGPMVRVVQELGTPPLWCHLGFFVQKYLKTRVAAFPADVAAWMGAFILGDQSGLDFRVIGSFKSVGLLHLLVLSGGHLSVIAGMCLLLSRLPWLGIYILGRLNALTWIKVCSVTTIMTGVILAAYCAAAGFSQSLQRSFLTYVVTYVLPMTGVWKPMRWRIAASVLIQAMIFPVNFLSPSMLMSWSGSLLLAAFVESTYLLSRWQMLCAGLQIQALFFASSLIFFGSAGILSIPANLVFQAVFAMLLPADIIVLLLRSDVFDHATVWVNRWIITLIGRVALFQEGLPVATVQVPSTVTLAAPAGRLIIVGTLVTLYFFAGIRGSAADAS